jgi:hypothetical protein
MHSQQMKMKMPIEKMNEEEVENGHVSPQMSLATSAQHAELSHESPPHISPTAAFSVLPCIIPFFSPPSFAFPFRSSSMVAIYGTSLCSH